MSSQQNQLIQHQFLHAKNMFCINNLKKRGKTYILIYFQVSHQTVEVQLNGKLRPSNIQRNSAGNFYVKVPI